MTTSITWNRDHEFTAVYPGGEEAIIASVPGAERPGPGPSPTDLVQGAVAACSGIDVVMILGKMRKTLHALRVESFVQREYLHTLRETELQVALESLSGSIGNMGLGRFDVHLGYRDRGLLLVTHHQSPFASMLSEREGFRCAILAGLHAGFLSYVAGRNLVAREITCSQSAEAPCRFLVGTERRLERLFDPVEGSTDDLLLQALGLKPASGDDHE